MATDPVCGVAVNEATALRADRGGQALYFCGDRCRRAFLAGEAAHDGGPPPPASNAAAGEVVSTCPTHPQVEQVGPGACPVCGMALEPKAARAGDGEDSGLAATTRRFRVAVALTAPLLLLAMLPMLGVPAGDRAGGFSPRLQLLLSRPVVLWCGWPFFARGGRPVASRNLNMFTLISLGVGAAYTHCLVAVLAPGLFPDSFRRHGQVEVYFEAGAVIVTLVLPGQVLELRAKGPHGGGHRRTAVAGPRPRPGS